jgi:nucleotide-binding universal stress UspA family protein
MMVAIDGSEESFDAASYAISLAEVYYSELITLYVVSDVTQNDYDSDMQDDKLPITRIGKEDNV